MTNQEVTIPVDIEASLDFQGETYRLTLEAELKEAPDGSVCMACQRTIGKSRNSEEGWSGVMLVDAQLVKVENVSTMTPPISCKTKLFQQLNELVEAKLAKKASSTIYHMDGDCAPDWDKFFQ